MTDNDLFDQFLHWLEKPYEEYSREEQMKLWEEFYALHLKGIEPWETNNED